MRRIFVLVALIVLAAYPAMAAAPGDKGAKELAAGQKQKSGEACIAPSARGGRWLSVPAGEFTMGSQDGRSRRTTGAQGVHSGCLSPWMCTK